nr:MAG TPA: hypothetical protein [Caudoviricetes sp.]
MIFQIPLCPPPIQCFSFQPSPINFSVLAIFLILNLVF